MSAVSKKLIPASRARLMKGTAGFFRQHPVAPFGVAIGHGAQADARDFEAGIAEADFFHARLLQKAKDAF